jgi:signal transduction histidine kinase
VVDVQRWGLSIEERSYDSADFQSRIIDLLAKLTKTDDILDFKVAKDFISLIEHSQNNSAEAVISNINRIAFESGNDTLIEQGKAALKKLREMQSARQEAERLAEEERKRAEFATKSLKQQISENLFLKSINTSDYEEMISLLHHVGIYAGTIDSNLKGISLRVQNEIPLSNAELNNIIRLISFETKKIMNIVSFATKANFKLKTDTIKVDLNSYIREYIQNIIPTVTDKKLNIKIESSPLFEFVREIKPIELNILIDNLISNAKKARAKNVTVILNINDGNFVVQFIDDGVGIQDDTFNLIYNLGFTTTDGAGIGLYHVKEIVGKLKGTITAENGLINGAIFTLVFK